MIPTAIFTTDWRLDRGQNPTEEECVEVIRESLKQVCEERSMNPALNIIKIESFRLTPESQIPEGISMKKLGIQVSPDGVPRIKVMAYVSDTLAIALNRR